MDDIDGIAPAIAIRQKNTTRNPRSTVATSTECFDFLRLLYARVGRRRGGISVRNALLASLHLRRPSPVVP